MSDDYRNALAEGTVLDTYRIERVLGEGGFGVTYLVTELNLGKEYAIKELIPDGVAIRQGGTTVMARSSSMEEDFEATRRHFIKEARVLATLKHPAIVAVHRLFEANGTCYMVMDYVEGETLGAYLKRQGGMLGSREEFEGIFYPLMDGLELLHGKDMIHRDIKPGNIMVTPDGSPVLLDFGASCRVENHTVTVTQMVSAGYSPFEQYTTRAKQGPYTDIYALGATMVRAITGAKPDDATDRMIGDTYSSLTVRSELVPVYGWELLSALDTSVMVKIEERPQSVRDWRKLMEVVVAPAEVEVPDSPKPQLEENVNETASPQPLPTIELSPVVEKIENPNSDHNRVKGIQWEDLLNKKLSGLSLILLAFFVILIWTVIVGESEDNLIGAGKQREREEITRKDEKPQVSISENKADSKTAPEPKDSPEKKPAQLEPKVTTLEEVAEAPLESLDRLAQLLVDGLRDEFPINTIKREKSAYLLLNQKMTWDEADNFAKRYGAHLAHLPATTDLAWFHENFQSPSPVWTGASDSGFEGRWVWGDGSAVDSKVWANKSPDNKAIHNGYGEDFGAISSSSPSLEDHHRLQKFPALLEWRLDGTTPASLASQLARTGEALNNKRSPVFPSGTYNVGGSRFLIVKDTVNWEEASRIASNAGGHLAVPSNEKEESFLTMSLKSALDESGSCWIGGKRGGSLTENWEYVTGETFSRINWLEDQPDNSGENKNYLVIKKERNSVGAKNEGRNGNNTGHFFVEWSVPALRNMPMKRNAKEMKAASTETDENRSKISTLKTGKNGGDIHQFRISENMLVDFCWCPPTGDEGFLMGSPVSQFSVHGAVDIRKRVVIKDGFWMAQTELTQKQWQSVMSGNPSYWRGANLPVESMNYNDIVGASNGAKGFLSKINQFAPEGGEYDLPNLAEWEYACRATTTTSLNSGTNLTSATANKCKNLGVVAWHIDNSGGRTQIVGTKKPNNWGLVDMHGNVFEWCLGAWSMGGSCRNGDARGFSSGSGSIHYLEKYRGGPRSWTIPYPEKTCPYSSAKKPSRAKGFRIMIRRKS